MTSKNRRFKSKEEHSEDINLLRNTHLRWRRHTREKKVGFFPIYTKDFVKKLPYISGNALKLYIYLGSFAKNDTGELMVSVKKMEVDFNCSRRTVHNWLEELIELKLIKRVQPGYKKSTHTFILPYTDIFLEDNLSVFKKIHYEEEEE